MKKWLTVSNIFTLLVVTIVVFLQAPSFLNNIRQAGTILPGQQYEVIGTRTSASVVFPPEKSRGIAIFWATWCGPCKVEMARLKSSVENGNIPREKIFAINLYEDQLVIKKFIAQNNYPFTFISAPEVAQQINVKATPTTLFLDNGMITSMSSGMSLIGIWKAEFFLR